MTIHSIQTIDIDPFMPEARKGWLFWWYYRCFCEIFEGEISVKTQLTSDRYTLDYCGDTKAFSSVVKYFKEKCYLEVELN